MSDKTYIHITTDLVTGTAKEDSKIESHCKVLITCANATKIKQQLELKKIELEQLELKQLELKQLELKKCIDQITNYNKKIQGIIVELDLFLVNTNEKLDTKKLANELFFTDLYNNSCYNNINNYELFLTINTLRTEIYSFNKDNHKKTLVKYIGAFIERLNKIIEQLDNTKNRMEENVEEKFNLIINLTQITFAKDVIPIYLKSRFINSTGYINTIDTKNKNFYITVYKFLSYKNDIKDPFLFKNLCIIQDKKFKKFFSTPDRECKL